MNGVNLTSKVYKLRKKQRRRINYRSSNFYKIINERFPQLFQLLLSDLLRVDGYSEVDIGIGLGIGVDVVRKIIIGNTNKIPEEIFFDILGLYAGVFCNWGRYKEDEVDSVLR